MTTSHKCTGPHKPEEGLPDHECKCGIGHDHTMAEYWEWDYYREPEEDDFVLVLDIDLSEE